MGKVFGREPALFLGACSAIINLLIAFDVANLSGEQVGLLNVALAAVVGFAVRSQVTPVK